MVLSHSEVEMKILLLTICMVLSFFAGSKIGGGAYFTFAAFPIFFLTKIPFLKIHSKWNVHLLILFPLAFLLCDFVLYLPSNLARGMSIDVYYHELWETLFMAVFVGIIQWIIYLALLCVEKILNKAFRN